MAFGDAARRSRWIDKLPSEAARAEMAIRLSELAGRGYSVGLRSSWHDSFENSWITSRDMRERANNPALRVDPLQIPYDPRGFSLASWADVRSIHVPVFDAAGEPRAAIGHFLTAAQRTSRKAVAHAIDHIKLAALQATLDVGGVSSSP
jgi:hypothetical protein